MSGHTPGPLVVKCSGLEMISYAQGPLYQGVGEYQYCVYDKKVWTNPDGSRGGDTPNIVVTVAPEDAVADARRLVACWNACIGITADELEEIARTGGMLGPREDVAKIAAQRDSLLDALEKLIEAVEDNKRDSLLELIAAHDAIANVRGAA